MGDLDQVQGMIEKLNKLPEGPYQKFVYHGCNVPKIMGLVAELKGFVGRFYTDPGQMKIYIADLNKIRMTTCDSTTNERVVDAEDFDNAKGILQGLLTAILADLPYPKPSKKEDAKLVIKNTIYNQQITILDAITVLENAIESADMPAQEKKSLLEKLHGIANNPYVAGIGTSILFEAGKNMLNL
ncbi:MAG: hypothetical protein ABR985_13005 [Methanotrichaceae archaeon]|jgi:hypothetical protein